MCQAILTSSASGRGWLCILVSSNTDLCQWERLAVYSGVKQCRSHLPVGGGGGGGGCVFWCQVMPTSSANEGMGGGGGGAEGDGRLALYSGVKQCQPHLSVGGSVFWCQAMPTSSVSGGLCILVSSNANLICQWGALYSGVKQCRPHLSMGGSVFWCQVMPTSSASGWGGGGGGEVGSVFWCQAIPTSSAIGGGGGVGLCILVSGNADLICQGRGGSIFCYQAILTCASGKGGGGGSVFWCQAILTSASGRGWLCILVSSNTDCHWEELAVYSGVKQY